MLPRPAPTCRWLHMQVCLFVCVHSACQDAQCISASNVQVSLGILSPRLSCKMYVCTQVCVYATMPHVSMDIQPKCVSASTLHISIQSASEYGYTGWRRRIASIYLSVGAYECIQKCMYVCLYVCVHVCMQYVCVHERMHVCMYMSI